MLLIRSGSTIFCTILSRLKRHGERNNASIIRVLRYNRTIHSANVLFKAMPEMKNEERATITSGAEELETRRANWDKWHTKPWPEEIKHKL